MGSILLMISIAMNQGLHMFYFDTDCVHCTSPEDEALWLADQQIVYTYFGTSLRAIFTMFEVTLGNWPPACRILAERVSESFFIIGIIHKLSIGFAAVGVMNAVFMQETFKTAAMDDNVMVRQKRRAKQKHFEKMQNLMQETSMHDDDDDHSTISREAFMKICSDPQVKLWLSSLELDVKDAGNLFRLIDDSNDGVLSVHELADGVAKLKGPAKSLDMYTCIHEQRELSVDVRTMEGKIEEAERQAERREEQFLEFVRLTTQGQQGSRSRWNDKPQQPNPTPQCFVRQPYVAESTFAFPTEFTFANPQGEHTGVPEAPGQGQCTNAPTK